MDKSKRFSGILLAGIILITIFTLSNSFSNYETSHSSSENIADLIISENGTDRQVIELRIRKIAHIVEFAVLGALAVAFIKSMHQCYAKQVFGYMLFYVLAVAVADEHIQSFSDRTSSTSDIILDFCGALIGFFIGWLIIKVYAMLKRRCSKKIGQGIE